MKPTFRYAPAVFDAKAVLDANCCSTAAHNPQGKNPQGKAALLISLGQHG
jgi:hypothetical protein